jgi:hypothetical protein
MFTQLIKSVGFAWKEAYEGDNPLKRDPNRRSKRTFKTGGHEQHSFHDLGSYLTEKNKPAEKDEVNPLR